MTDAEVRDLIRAMLTRNSRKSVAMKLRCCANNLERLMDGTMELRKRHLDELGFRRVVTYERIGAKEAPAEPEPGRAIGSGTYRGWRVTYAETPLPVRSFDWFATHPDLSGPDDDRLVHSDTFEGVCGAVDAWLAAEVTVARLIRPKLTKPRKRATIELMQNASDGTRRVVRG